MATNYLYLDDEKPEAVRPFLRELKRYSENLEIEHHPPLSYHNQLPWLARETFDGLILDLRLDQFANWQEGSEGDKAEYRATTLAQELRTRATERQGVFEVPIVLWSTDERLKASYTRDDTSHDLFDLKCVKSDISDDADKAKAIAGQLTSLALGYQEIVKVRSRKKGRGSQLHRFLGFEKLPKFLDARILSYFDGRPTPLPAHEYARFILRDLLSAPGPLISEQVLAARLGIDKEASEDWSKLKARVGKQASYSGPFQEGWPRWWAPLVEAWWRGLSKDVPPLRLTPAANRVEQLRKWTRLKGLVSAKPIGVDYSESYWTICQVTQQPLDPRDGLILNQKDAKIWQEKLYVSLKAELTGKRREQGLILDPLESSRLERLKGKVS